MFTFLTISYNQEKIIIEHLESIKNQIKNYGVGKGYEYIFSDDCSKDNTVKLTREWLQKNESLFNKIKILNNKVNKGTVKNYLNATAHINTKSFKLLGGDDLYFRNNILDIEEGYDLVFTPVITFQKNTITGCIPTNHLLTKRNNEEFAKLTNHGNFFNSPGAFISNEIINDINLRNFLSNYKWIEDIPQWYYLFNYKKNIKVKVDCKPYILYRKSVGISYPKADCENREMVLERNDLVKEFNLKVLKYPKFINPYRYYYKYLSLKLKHYDSIYNKEVAQANEIMTKEISAANIYLDNIKKETKAFYKTIGKQELYDYE